MGEFSLPGVACFTGDGRGVEDLRPVALPLEVGLRSSKGCPRRLGSWPMLTIVKLSSLAYTALSSVDWLVCIRGVLRNGGAANTSSSSGGLVNGIFTMVKLSSLDGVNVGVSTPVPRLDRGDGRGRWLSVLDLLLAAEAAAVFGRRAGVFAVDLVAVEALDLEGLRLGLMVGVLWLPARLLAAYGSAVAGRVSSGLRGGRRTGAAMREPEAELLGA